MMESEMDTAFHSESASDRAFSSAGSIRSRRAFTLLELLAVMAILSLITVSLFTIFQQGSETWRLSAARTEAYIKARHILEMMSREIRGAVLISAARGPKADPILPGLDDPKRADFVGLNGDEPFSGVPSTLQGWRNNEQPFSDQIYFVAPVTNSGAQVLCMLGYWIKDVEGDTQSPLTIRDVPRNSEDDTFWRLYLSDGGPAEPTDEWKLFDFTSSKLNSYVSQTGEVATSVRQLDIKYYDYESTGGSTPVLKEYDQWDSLPSAKDGTTSTNKDDNKLPAAVKITITVGDKNNLIKGVRLSTIVYLENARRR
jgi:prepilin-type N-terminal cleavage/methylation domain-containing protein